MVLDQAAEKHGVNELAAPKTRSHELSNPIPIYDGMTSHRGGPLWAMVRAAGSCRFMLRLCRSLNGQIERAIHHELHFNAPWDRVYAARGKFGHGAVKPNAGSQFAVHLSLNP
jgi:hypothetical protein